MDRPARGNGARIDQLTINKLSVHDERPPTPTEPMESLVLPLPVSLAFDVDAFELSGNTEFALSQLKGDYQYGPIGAQLDAPALPASQGLTDAHQLRIDSLQIADGRYEGKLSLGAQAPMPLAMALVGEIQTQVPDGAGVQLTLHAQANGTLSGEQAAIDVQAEAQGTPDTPRAQASTLALNARVMPWAKQPLVSAQANAQSLNLAALWPSAPATDLSGTLQAQPEANNSWRAELQLDNTLIAPADQKGLPVQSLQARITQQGDRWTIEQLQAQLGGGGLQGKGGFRLLSQEGATTLTDWEGDIQAKGIRPALLWSTLAKGALNASASASAAPDNGSPDAVNVKARIEPSAQQPKGTALTGLRLNELRLQGQWRPSAAPKSASPTAGELKLTEAHIAIAGAELDTQGSFNTERMSYDGKLNLVLPGVKFDAQGLLAHASGKGQGRLEIARRQAFAGMGAQPARSAIRGRADQGGPRWTRSLERWRQRQCPVAVDRRSGGRRFPGSARQNHRHSRPAPDSGRTERAPVDGAKRRGCAPDLEQRRAQSRWPLQRPASERQRRRHGARMGRGAHRQRPGEP